MFQQITIWYLPITNYRIFYRGLEFSKGNVLIIKTQDNNLYAEDTKRTGYCRGKPSGKKPLS